MQQKEDFKTAFTDLLRNTYIDTLPMGQALFPGLRNYKLDTINKHLEIPPFNHHRAVDDALVTAKIFIELIKIKKSLPKPV